MRSNAPHATQSSLLHRPKRQPIAMEATEPTMPGARTTAADSTSRLPTEIILLILIHLDHHTLLAATASCRQWYTLARDYRQYIWRHLAQRDFPFTAARGLWRLDFLKDKDLRVCFPPQQRPLQQQQQQQQQQQYRRSRYQQQQESLVYGGGQNHSIYSASFLQPNLTFSSPQLPSTMASLSLYHSPGMTLDSTKIGSEPAPICASCWVNLQETGDIGVQSAVSKEYNTPLNKGLGVANPSLVNAVQQTTSKLRVATAIEQTEAPSWQETQSTEEVQETHTNNPLDNTKRSLLSYSNCVSCLQSLDRKGKQRVNNELSSSQDFDAGDLQYNDDSSSEEQDWKALYQMTSNWYRGRAKGYCPLMLPSLTTLASATRALSDRSSLELGLDDYNTEAKAPSGTGSGSSTGIVADTYRSLHCTPAQIAIQRLLKKRKPVAVIGLQHEGSSLTAVSLAKIPVEPGSHKQAVQLLRSNPHYREKRPALTSSNDQLASSTGTSSASISNVKPPNPNIMIQDPRKHDRVSFAIHTAPPKLESTSDVSGMEGVEESTEQGSGALPQNLTTAAISPAPTSGQPSLRDLANDILCHYSSPLHSFLVTGHIDGVVRLWDLSIQEPGRQCIRYWQTGPRRRVLCVGMNSKVVVCGNVDSTICVWDIHPSPGSSSSTHGTIHTASYMTSRAPHGLDDWISGIEHICVGDSLVACSTEFSGSVLVFSLGTGSLVYEIPGLYQPSKMCMTDFFLLTGGRGAWNQGGTHRRHNQPGQGHGQYQHQYHLQGQANFQEHHGLGIHAGGLHYGQDTDNLRHPQQQGLGSIEMDEYMSCCVNVWDLRTGNRLYSLIPRLPMRHLQQSKNLPSILCRQKSRSQREKGQKQGKKQTIRTTSYSPMIGMTQHAGQWTMPHSPPTTVANDQHLFNESNNAAVFSSHDSNNNNYNNEGEPGSFSPLSPQQPISAPLTLLDITVTPDHSTLVVTLCERSGEGLEGVYCWDFSGSRLEGYHEEAPDVSTMIMDQNDLEYRTVANTVLADDHDEDEDDGFLDNDDDIDNNNDTDGDHYQLGEQLSDDEEDDRYSNDRIHNNMVMQQVDSTVLKDMHRARVTGKLWIGWKLDERQFLRRKERALARAKASITSSTSHKRSSRQFPFSSVHQQQQSLVNSSLTTSVEQLSM